MIVEQKRNCFTSVTWNKTHAQSKQKMADKNCTHNATATTKTAMYPGAKYLHYLIFDVRTEDN